MQITKQLITPEEAKKLLNVSVGNRNISERKVSQYANDIRTGRWIEDTYEFIKISKEGFLLDGHHRLNAIILAKTAINLNVVRGVDATIMGVIDTGKSRNPSDALKIYGVTNSNNIAATISLVIKNELGYSVGTQICGLSTISNVDIIKRYEESPEYWQNLHSKCISIYLKINKILTASTISKYYHLFSQKHPTKVDAFFAELIGGVETNATITILRSTLIRNKISQKKLSTLVLNAFIIKTWNAYITKTELKLLKFDTLNSEIPTIK
jgi:hypothetical protein